MKLSGVHETPMRLRVYFKECLHYPPKVVEAMETFSIICKSSTIICLSYKPIDFSRTNAKNAKYCLLPNRKLMNKSGTEIPTRNHSKLHSHSEKKKKEERYVILLLRHL